jgi:hypothetical protein
LNTSAWGSGVRGSEVRGSEVRGSEVQGSEVRGERLRIEGEKVRRREDEKLRRYFEFGRGNAEVGNKRMPKWEGKSWVHGV